jgi:N-acetyl-gamma-glutamylphosphate reductase
VTTRKVAIIGASGFAGLETLRLCAMHPELEVVVATGESMAGTRAAQLYPSLEAVYPNLVFAPTSSEAADGCDVVFLGMPHGASQDIVADLIGRAGLIIDLAADFRLKDPELYARWYGEVHRHPERSLRMACPNCSVRDCWAQRKLRRQGAIRPRRRWRLRRWCATRSSKPPESL